MANSINWWKWSVIVGILIFVFFYGRKCGKDSVKPTIITLTNIDTVFDETKIIDTQYIPIIHRISKYDIDTFYLTKKDTITILGDYFSKKYYSDTAIIEYGSIVINDTISMNKILSRGLEARLYVPTIQKTFTLEKPETNTIYLGLNANGGSQNYFYSIGGDVSILNKKGRMWSLGVKVTTENQFLLEAGARFPLKK